MASSPRALSWANEGVGGPCLGRRARPRSKRAGMVVALVGTVVAATLGFAGCTADETSPAQEGGVAVGVLCDAIVEPMCAYAVESCGEPGPVVRCVDRAKPACCQGACSRPARWLRDPAACVKAYVGEGSADDAGVGRAETPPLGCDAVLAGFAPEPCRDLFEFL